MPTDAPPVPPHARRKRYRGTHPRAFAEKYKELNADEFVADVDKVIARGQTPAGTHRSICVDEILAVLKPAPGDVVLDATMGFGGHTQTLVPRVLPGGRVFAIDVDTIELPRTEERLRKLGFDNSVLQIRNLNFSAIHKLLPDSGGGFDGILADFGVSSMQLDNPVRGFSFKHDGPLDLRLNSAQGEPASALLASVTEAALAELLVSNADETHAYVIARQIKKSRVPILTTLQLSEVVAVALQRFPERRDQNKTLARVFQALRIAVNDEYGVIDRFLEKLPRCLKPGGRVALLSFHSGEDGRVAQAFQQSFAAGVYSSIAPEPMRASPEEQRSNPRSTSARLRWAIRSTLSVERKR